MQLDELEALADANNGDRATRILQILRRSKRDAVAVEEDDKPLVEWLIEQLIASRRGARSIAIDKIGPDDRDSIHTSFSNQNKMYGVFRRYSGAQSPEVHAEWVDEVVGALDEWSRGGWSSLTDDQKQAISDNVEPFLRRLREASEREFVGRASPLVA